MRAPNYARNLADLPHHLRGKSAGGGVNRVPLRGGMTRPFGVVLLVFALAVTVLVANLTTAQQFSEWSSPTNLNAIVLSDGTPCPAVVNSAHNDQHPAVSKDGLSLVFTSDRPRPNGVSDGFHLWVTQRASVDDCWQESQYLGDVVNIVQPPFACSPVAGATPICAYAPNLTTDGHWMYFHSNRTDGCNGGVTHGELWVTHRHDTRDNFGWEKPINLGCAINTQGFVLAGPTHFEDDTTGIQYLYFTRRPIGKSDDYFAVYVSVCAADLATCNTQGLWGPGERVDALFVPPDLTNNFGRTTRTAIRRRDGLEMIFSSRRAGGVGRMIELWTSTRSTTLDQNWSAPVNLGTVVNSTANNGAPSLSWDGTELYFYSNRTDLPGAHMGVNDLYVSKRNKVK